MPETPPEAPRRADLRQHLDDLVEHCQRQALPLRAAQHILLPVLRKHLRARLVFLACPDDRLKDAFYWDGSPVDGVKDEVLTRFRDDVSRDGTGILTLERFTLQGVALDFAGERLGIVGAVIDSSTDGDRARVLTDLGLFSEQVDGYIGGLAADRRKSRLLTRLSSALKHPVLETGIRAAMAELHAAIGYSAFLLVYVEQEEDREAVRILSDGVAMRAAPSPERLAKVLFGAGRREGSTPALYRFLRTLGISTFVHEQLITGIRDETILGSVIVSCADRELSTFDKDVLRIFAGLLRLRLVDFNRERRGLLRAFAPPHASRLLSSADYFRKYLRPRKRTTAVIFADIDNFTEISEQRLVKPELVLELVERWATGCREIVHEHLGVLDKVIGDCVLALFGPPFFGEDYASDAAATRDSCARAIRAAIAIRDYTETLRIPGGGRLAAGIGLNVAPLAVGMMGVGENYTGYGRGMNEAARLQDLAGGGEILVSETFARRLGKLHGIRFGPLMRRGVQGVKKALPYRMLVRRAAAR